MRMRSEENLRLSLSLKILPWMVSEKKTRSDKNLRLYWRSMMRRMMTLRIPTMLMPKMMTSRKEMLKSLIIFSLTQDSS